MTARKIRRGQPVHLCFVSAIFVPTLGRIYETATDKTGRLWSRWIDHPGDATEWSEEPRPVTQ